MNRSNQGFLGALIQYWTIDEKPRLNRRNSWFRDHQPKPQTLNSFLFISIFIVGLSMIVVILGGIF